LAAVGLGWVFRLTALSTTTVSPGGSDLACASVLSPESQSGIKTTL
jgi:hypothetical protein